MTKRIFSLIMAIAVMTTMLTAFSLDAYAIGSVYEEDFADTSYDSFKVITGTNKTTATYSNDGGALKIQRTGSNNQLYADFHDFDGKKTVVLEFDFYSDTANTAGLASGIPYISNTMYFTVGTKSIVFASGHRFYADGNWYRYRIVATSNGTNITSVTSTRKNLTTGVTLSGDAGAQVMGSQPNDIRMVVNTANADFKIDNLRIYDESALIDGDFKIGTTPVTAAAQITAGDLVATANVAAVVAKSGLEKFMVAFDKTGKMLDVVTASQALTANATTAVTATMTLDAAKAAAIADEGYVGFYLWDGMYPEVKALELK